MSSRSIAAYQAHTGQRPPPSLTPRCFGRTARTQPPPAPIATAAELLEEAAVARQRALADLERVPAWRELRRAEEMERAARSMHEALETGCLDDGDPRHPRHPLWCPKPCCAGREP